MQKQTIIVTIALALGMQAAAQSSNAEQSLKSSINSNADEDKMQKKLTKQKNLAAAYGGANASNIKTKTTGSGYGDDTYNGGLTGFQAGVEVGIANLNKNLSVFSGLGFSQQGAKYKGYNYEYTPGGGANYGEVEVKRRMNYLTMPIGVRWQPNPEKGIYALGGIQAGLLLSANDKQGDKKTNVKDNFKGFDAGFTAGIGYALNRQWQADLRVTPSLSNMVKEGEGTHRHLVVGLRVHYNFLASSKKEKGR